MRYMLWLGLGALVIAVTGCATAADIVSGILKSGTLESLAAGTAESMIAANTDLSGTETAALAGVIATSVRSMVAKPLEGWISRNWGSGAEAA